MNKKLCGAAVLAVAAFSTAASAQSDEVTVSLNADLRPTLYGLRIGSSDSFRVNLDDGALDIGIGGTVSYKNWFLDGYVRVPVTSGGGEFSANGIPDDSLVGLIDNLGFASENNRFTAGAAIGYRVTPQFNIFAGLRYGLLESSLLITDENASANFLLNEFEYTSWGPQIGMSYSARLASRDSLTGSVGLQAAFADFDYTVLNPAELVGTAFGEVPDSNDFTPLPQFDSIGGRSDTIGFFASLTYTHSFEDGWAVQLGGDGYLFNYGVFGNGGGGANGAAGTIEAIYGIPQDDQRVQEWAISARLRIVKRF